MCAYRLIIIDLSINVIQYLLSKLVLAAIQAIIIEKSWEKRPFATSVNRPTPSGPLLRIEKYICENPNNESVLTGILVMKNQRFQIYSGNNCRSEDQKDRD